VQDLTADALLALLEQAVAREWGGVERFAFASDCPGCLTAGDGGVVAAAPEYRALAAVTYLRWLRHEWAMREREREILKRRSGMHLVRAREARR